MGALDLNSLSRMYFCKELMVCAEKDHEHKRCQGDKHTRSLWKTSLSERESTNLGLCVKIFTLGKHSSEAPLQAVTTENSWGSCERFFSGFITSAGSQPKMGFVRGSTGLFWTYDWQIHQNTYQYLSMCCNLNTQWHHNIYFLFSKHVRFCNTEILLPCFFISRCLFWKFNNFQTNN